MASSRFVLILSAALILASGSAFAQEDANFYADPVLPDPPQHVAHPLASAVATADVAAVSPAAGEKPSREHTTPCSALNPCAIAARS